MSSGKKPGLFKMGLAKFRIKPFSFPLRSSDIRNPLFLLGSWVPHRGVGNIHIGHPRRTADNRSSKMDGQQRLFNLRIERIDLGLDVDRL